MRRRYLRDAWPEDASNGRSKGTLRLIHSAPFPLKAARAIFSASLLCEQWSIYAEAALGVSDEESPKMINYDQR